ncbi:MAG: HEPN domain-containing protein [Candidatus Woesearchaeota archaeon]
MREIELQNFLNDTNLLNERISLLLKEKQLIIQNVDKEEIKGHLEKSDNNLRFVKENIKLNFLDWAITGCYYSCYHSALALIQTKKYSSKNHLATLLILIKEFYKKEISKEDIDLLSGILDYEDILFYVESKNKREEATYSTKTKFDEKYVENLRIKSIMFVNKVKSIVLKNL